MSRTVAVAAAKEILKNLLPQLKNWEPDADQLPWTWRPMLRGEGIRIYFPVERVDYFSVVMDVDQHRIHGRGETLRHAVLDLEEKLSRARYAALELRNLACPL